MCSRTNTRGRLLREHLLRRKSGNRDTGSSTTIARVVGGGYCDRDDLPGESGDRLGDYIPLVHGQLSKPAKARLRVDPAP